MCVLLCMPKAELFVSALVGGFHSAAPRGSRFSALNLSTFLLVKDPKNCATCIFSFHPARGGPTWNIPTLGGESRRSFCVCPFASCFPCLLLCLSAAVCGWDLNGAGFRDRFGLVSVPHSGMVDRVWFTWFGPPNRSRGWSCTTVHSAGE